ncbi:MAG TPA: TonB-dependent receptor plug domain-containing protein, partial [Bradyrhizobium sp.]|nr:TonB-dependent receptor plug domain-containing protein [Bradyrhizobium sp.]
MSSAIIAAKRRRSLLLATALVASSLLIIPAVYAQTPPANLPPVDVNPPTDQNKTRARPVTDEGGGAPRQVRSATPAQGTGSGSSDGASAGPGTGNARQFDGIVGASSTVITAEQIAHSPAYSLPEIIAQVPGVQLQSFYGGVNGAKTSIDLRGFGAFATANTLVLINGRRLNDVDMAQVDLSTIPLNSIERIEITRGNSGAVLYGDNAVGGVINIVTKSGVGGPPITIRGEAGVGSFNQRLANLSAATNYGPWSSSFYGNAVKSDGYRDNNALDQRNGVGNLNYTTPDLKAFLT